jgi:hypothetical protein
MAVARMQDAEPAKEYESRRDSWMSGELRRVLKTLEGLIVAVVDGATGVDPGGRRADDHHHRGGGEHHD